MSQCEASSASDPCAHGGDYNATVCVFVPSEAVVFAVLRANVSANVTAINLNVTSGTTSSLPMLINDIFEVSNRRWCVCYAMSDCYPRSNGRDFDAVGPTAQ